MKIIEIAEVTYGFGVPNNGESFMKDVSAHINKYQKYNLDVEIQYWGDSSARGALIIGREKKTKKVYAKKV